MRDRHVLAVHVLDANGTRYVDAGGAPVVYVCYTDCVRVRVTAYVAGVYDRNHPGPRYQCSRHDARRELFCFSFATVA